MTTKNTVSLGDAPEEPEFESADGSPILSREEVMARLRQEATNEVTLVRANGSSRKINLPPGNTTRIINFPGPDGVHVQYVRKEGTDEWHEAVTE
jgi:hypothetical protein